MSTARQAGGAGEMRHVAAGQNCACHPGEHIVDLDLSRRVCWIQSLTLGQDKSDWIPCEYYISNGSALATRLRQPLIMCRCLATLTQDRVAGGQLAGKDAHLQHGACCHQPSLVTLGAGPDACTGIRGMCRRSTWHVLPLFMACAAGWSDTYGC